jgi:hypothetical protein
MTKVKMKAADTSLSVPQNDAEAGQFVARLGTLQSKCVDVPHIILPKMQNRQSISFYTMNIGQLTADFSNFVAVLQLY